MTQLQSIKYKYQRVLYSEYATITVGNSTSNVIDCGGMQPIAIVIPGNFTAGNIQFNGGDDMNNLGTISNIDGSILIINVPGQRQIPLVPYLFIGCPYFQIQVPNQSQQVAIKVMMMPIFQGIHN